MLVAPAGTEAALGAAAFSPAPPCGGKPLACAPMWLRVCLARHG